MMALMSVVVWLGGCSTPAAFTAYHGTEIFQGAGGGDEDDVDGIEVWRNGEPNRKYQILGIVAQGHSGHKRGRLSGLFGGDQGSAIAKTARDHGGDAVMIVVKELPVSDTDDGDFGGGHHRTVTLVIIKYMK